MGLNGAALLLLYVTPLQSSPLNDLRKPAYA